MVFILDVKRLTHWSDKSEQMAKINLFSSVFSSLAVLSAEYFFFNEEVSTLFNFILIILVRIIQYYRKRNKFKVVFFCQYTYWMVKTLGQFLKQIQHKMEDVAIP